MIGLHATVALVVDIKHRSPGITAIFNAVKGSSKNGILDLGTALGRNLSFYSQLGCHFQFEDFSQTITEFQRKGLSDSQAIAGFLNDLDGSKKYDVVLFWDLLNYLPKQSASLLIDKLRPFLAPNALIHMIGFVGATMPAFPSKFTINDQYQLQISCSKDRVALIHRVTTMQLVKMFPDFLMVQSYLNGDGMVPGFSEQILRFGAKSQEKGTVFSSSETASSGLKIEKRIHSPSVMRFLTQVRQNRTLLDLGPKRTLNYDFWKKDYQTVAATDLQPLLSRYFKTPGTERGNYLKQGRFLDFDADRKFDVIVAWDLFNYCPEPLLKELGRRIVRHCKDGTHLIVMSYSGKTMPAVPQFFLVDDKGVGFAKQGEQKIRDNSRKLTSSLILKSLPGFYVEKTFAFRRGMQKGMNEYLFVFKDEKRLEVEKRALVKQVMARREAKRLEAKRSKVKSKIELAASDAVKAVDHELLSIE